MEKDIVIELAIKKLSEAFDEFIGACLGPDGKPRAPDYKAMMKARGYLPPYCEHALAKKHNGEGNSAAESRPTEPKAE